MLTLSINSQNWVAQFSNGHLFNESGQGQSDIEALVNLATRMRTYHTQTPVIRKMANSVDRIATRVDCGEDFPFYSGVNLAEY